ncbi:hypothetical protein EB796_019515 [Bugula neritina]|uniref:Uncharacterized protein n=1 Tax=Bugula neritina TaxID=10212 RepID=A0A7J7JA11_BUGNE|nr:hypothetical protein EB796_019515 [Bugula neritina]
MLYFILFGFHSSTTTISNTNSTTTATAATTAAATTTAAAAAAEIARLLPEDSRLKDQTLVLLDKSKNIKMHTWRYYCFFIISTITLFAQYRQAKDAFICGEDAECGVAGTCNKTGGNCVCKPT